MWPEDRPNTELLPIVPFLPLFNHISYSNRLSSCYLAHFHHQTLVLVRTVTVGVFYFVALRNGGILFVDHLIWSLTSSATFGFKLFDLSLKSQDFFSQPFLFSIVRVTYFIAINYLWLLSFSVDAEFLVWSLHLEQKEPENLEDLLWNPHLIEFISAHSQGRQLWPSVHSHIDHLQRLLVPSCRNQVLSPTLSFSFFMRCVFWSLR